MAPEDTLAMPRGLSGGIHYDPEAFGRFSETLARFFGTARFLEDVTDGVVDAQAGRPGPQLFFPCRHGRLAEVAKPLLVGGRLRGPTRSGKTGEQNRL